MRPIIIKEGPIVFLRNVIIMEILASIVFFGLSFLENYEMAYESMGLIKILRYDVFVMFAFSVFQVTYIVALFFNWYFHYYEIYEKEIVRKTGIFFKRSKTVDLGDVVAVEIYESPIGRLTKHATIILEHTNDRITKIRNVANYKEYEHLISQLVRDNSRRLIQKDLQSLIKDGENSFVEFKETLRFDIKKNEVNKDVERSVIKTIVGFMNAEGGMLVIGVKDDGSIEGLERDYKTLPKKNADGFENYLNLLIKNNIGLEFTKYVNVRFEKIDNKEICAVSIKHPHKPSYLKNADGNEEFFVRVGNSSQPFKMSQAEEYIKGKWK